MRLARMSVLGLGLLLVFSPPVPAGTRVGLVGGLNLSRFSGALVPPEITFSGATNLGLGGVVEVDVSRHVSLASTPMLLQKGTAFQGWGSASDTTGTVDMTYLELPLLARYSLGSNGLRPYLTAGPTLGFRRQATLTRIRTAQAPVTEDIEEITQGVDLGLAVGAGVVIPAGRVGFLLDARYSFGLLPVQAVPPGWTYTFERGPFNRGLFLSLGATFGLGH